MGRKLKVKEHNEEEKYIILEEDNSVAFFFKKYGKLIGLILLLLLLIVGGLIGYNIYSMDKTSEPSVSYSLMDVSFDGLDLVDMNGTPVTEDYARRMFDNYYNGYFKRNGEVWTIKDVNTKGYRIFFFSDGTSLKIEGGVYTRIAPLTSGDYGIGEDGKLKKGARTKNVTVTKTEKIFGGRAYYFSDGSSYIQSSIGNMFVRNSKDISSKFISDNRVSYYSSKKSVGNYELTYYTDGSIWVVNGNDSYVVRSSNDISISDNSISYPNDNQGKFIDKKVYDNDIVIFYYSDGSAIIKQGKNSISVRKSNSIVISGNKFIAIESSRYVEISGERTTNDGNRIIYLTNGAAIVDYNSRGTNIYVKENSDIKYRDNNISDVGTDIEKETSNREVNGQIIREFETVVYVDSYNGKKLIDNKDNILYDTDGSVKKLKDEDSDNIKGGSVIISNNTDKTLVYRIAIEESDNTTLNAKYVKYMIGVNGDISSNFINKNIWKMGDKLDNNKRIDKTTYILYTGEIAPFGSSDINLSFWIDYESIGNDMMSKAWIGTMKVYGGFKNE